MLLEMHRNKSHKFHSIIRFIWNDFDRKNVQAKSTMKSTFALNFPRESRLRFVKMCLPGDR